MSGAPASGKLQLRPLLRLISRTYRRHAGFLAVAALLIVIPAALLDVLGERLGDWEVDELGDIAILGAALFLFGTSVGHQLYTGMISSTVVATRAGQARPTLRWVVGHVPVIRLVAADIIYSLGLAVALLLLIVPGVLFATWYALIAPVIEVERRGLRAAFRRSRELVRGHFWLVFVTVTLFTILSEGLAVAITEGSEALAGHALVVEWIGTVLAELVAIPIYGVALVTLMLELRALRGEGEGSAS